MKQSQADKRQEQIRTMTPDEVVARKAYLMRQHAELKVREGKRLEQSG